MDDVKRLLADFRREMPGMPTADYAVLSMVLLNRIEQFLTAAPDYEAAVEALEGLIQSMERLSSYRGNDALDTARAALARLRETVPA